MTTDDTLDAKSAPRRGRRSAAAGVVALLALAACTSDPGPRRVAEDIIEAQAIENPALDEKCMLDALGEFTDDQLDDITNDLDSSNAGTQADGQAALDEFEAALTACNS